MDSISIAATKRGKDKSIEGVFTDPKVILLVPTLSRALRRDGEIFRLIEKAKASGGMMLVFVVPRVVIMALHEHVDHVDFAQSCWVDWVII